MPAPFSAVVTVSTPPRGSVVPASFVFRASECVCTWTWGLQPATALIEWPDGVTIPRASAMQIELGGHTFYGLCKSQAPVNSHDGKSTMQEFMDTRDFLMWDHVFCAFNMRESKIVNGKWIRRYWHILPGDYASYRKTYTNAPYTAREILDFIFSAPTVESPWVRFYHVALNTPVYGLDYTSGPKLGSVVTEISEKLGTVFTLLGGWYNLVWAVKGETGAPDFPANSTARRLGWSLSGFPTRVTAVGGRNTYQVLNCDLIADWAPGWPAFYDLDIFAEDLFLFEVTEAPFADIAKGTPYASIAGDDSSQVGWQLAEARARTITVGEYAALRDARSGDGNSFRDFRKFANKSRMQMPVALYLRMLLFRAFRFPPGFTLRNAAGMHVPLVSMELVEQALAEVSHDPVTGEIFVVGPDVVSAGNGYLIAQGFQVAADSFKTLRPEHFDLDQWRTAQLVWQRVPFQIDNSGEGDYFVICETQVINTENLLDDVVIDDVQANYPSLRANSVITVPAVRGALVLRAERFRLTLGEGTRDGVENMEGLNGEFIAYANGSAPSEIPFADGQTATQKAAAILNTLLGRQFTYELGGYCVQGSNATQLSSAIDRVTIRHNANGGTEEEVDFTCERAPGTTVQGAGGRQVVSYRREVERDFDRRAQLLPLLPGQRELKEESNQFRVVAAGLRANAEFRRSLIPTFYNLMGLDAHPYPVRLAQGGGTIGTGTPVFRDGVAKYDNGKPVNPIMPGSNLGGNPLQSPVFVGATVFHGERGSGPVRVTGFGDGGVLIMRVKGPVSVGDRVGYDKANNSDYLISGGDPAVGAMQEEIKDAKVRLVRVKVIQGGGGMNWRGQFKEENSPYAIQDVVYVQNDGQDPYHLPEISEQDGVKIFSIAGVYICVQAVPKLDPDNPDPDTVYQPRYPLPTDEDDIYWRLLALGQLAIPDCDGNGVQITAWGDTQPVPSQDDPPAN